MIKKKVKIEDNRIMENQHKFEYKEDQKIFGKAIARVILTSLTKN